MNFTECMETNPPRLVVQYKHGHDGEEQFEWGIVGNMPLLSLIGRIFGIQADLSDG
mgnify:FL=1